MTEHYGALFSYYTDLHGRYLAQQEWKKRHPDYLSAQFRADQRRWEEYVSKKAFYESELGRTTIHSVIDPLGPFLSSFNPEDLQPHTADLITVELLLNLMRTTLDAYRKAHES